MDCGAEHEMTWILVTFSLIIIWVASLCKIFYGSSSTGKTMVLNDGEVRKKNVLLVIAHPDDESMFFCPTINYLTSNKYSIHILCLSTGNADGMGSIRKAELHRACAVLKVPLQQVKVLDHPNLQDGFGIFWSHDVVAKIVEDEVTTLSIDSIVTFDKYGVSGHCNHQDVHYGVKKFLQDTSLKNIDAWELVSINIMRKYSGPMEIWLGFIYGGSKPSKVIMNQQPLNSLNAMAQHSSQWVWFRKLFVAFSSYTYTNTIRRIDGS